MYKVTLQLWAPGLPRNEDGENPGNWLNDWINRLLFNNSEPRFIWDHILLLDIIGCCSCVWGVPVNLHTDINDESFQMDCSCPQMNGVSHSCKNESNPIQFEPGGKNRRAHKTVVTTGRLGLAGWVRAKLCSFPFQSYFLHFFLFFFLEWKRNNDI